MREKTKKIYETAGELQAAIKNGSIKVNDEFETFDVDDEAVFVVAHVGKHKIRFVRKYLLNDDKSMKTDNFDLLEWLNTEYKNTLPDDIREMIGENPVTLPTEKQIYGENEIGKEEKRKQWDYFKNPKHRIAFKEDGRYSCYWWTKTPYYEEDSSVVSSANFAHVRGAGRATTAAASYSLGVRPAFAIKA